jgi:hypothetical protein
MNFANESVCLITFGMKRSFNSVAHFTALCFTASSAIHAWEFDLLAVGGSYQNNHY